MRTLLPYLRVSTKRQGKSGLGLEAQQAGIEAFAQQHGCMLLEPVVEIASGGLPVDYRPVLKNALEAVRKGKRDDVWLVVYRLDRLSRDVADIATLLKQGHKIVIVQFGFDVDLLSLHIHAAVAEDEKRKIGLRTRDGLQRAKLRGKVLGNPGLSDAREASKEASSDVANNHARAVVEIFTLIHSQHKTLQATADKLNQLNVPTARGGQWHASSVRNVLNRLKQQT